MEPARQTTWGSRRSWALMAALAVVSTALVVARVSRPEEIVAAPVTTATTTPPTTPAPTTIPPTTTTTFPEPVPPSSTATVTLKGKVTSYAGPGGPATGTVDSRYYDRPTALPVIEEADGGWLHVRTPYKPNGSSTWIKKSDATLDSTPWAIEIDVTRMHLKLYDAGELVVDAAVGVGTDVTPTAQGDFFVAFQQAPENASYGPFVVVTSGHSNVIQSFGGFPDGILAIHGPIGSDGMIADTGAKISNGCIRMHVADQVKLQSVTPGTPVHIYASPPPNPVEPPAAAPPA